MMRALRLFTLNLAVCLGLGLTCLSVAADKPPLTLESIFSSDVFISRHIDNLQWLDDDSGFTFSRRDADSGKTAIFRYSAATGEESIVVAADSLVYNQAPIDLTGYHWGSDRRFLLIDGPRTRTWDSVIEGPHYVYDSETNSVAPLADGSVHLRNVHISPDGRSVGYVLDNNLYVLDLKTRETRAVTSDGSANIWNGILDYGSTMFGYLDAWKWSPDSRQIAFLRLDVTDVKVWYMVDELGKYPEIRPLKYPNTAEKHAVYQVGVYDLQNGKTVWMDIGDNPDDYIPRIDWTASSKLLSIQRLTRDHGRLDLLLADTANGNSRTVLTEHDPAWIDITEDLTFLNHSNRFVWTSEKSGFRHAYLYDLDGNARQLTDGDWEISRLISVDENDGWLYFYAKKDSLIDQHVYRVRLEGSDVEKLSAEPGWYEWAFSPKRSYVVETWSDARTPPVIRLRKPDGSLLRTLVENRLPGFEMYAVPHPEFMQIETSDGIVLNTYMIRPPDFDPAKKYPVVAYGYGNAGSQMVINRWGSARGAQRDLWHRYMAGQGYVVWSLDNRTTTGRGKQAYNMTYGEYGKWAIHDQVEGAKYLRTLPYIDPDRLGFWGWSGGGYLAAALMTKGAPHFQVGVSVAPVIDLINYQAVGVERWMDQLEVNPEGYAAVNLMNFADRLEGDLLLIHGTGDENVKWAFTLQFADSLIKAGKLFDMMVYPNEHHGIEGARMHVYSKIADYFHKNL